MKTPVGSAAAGIPAALYYTIPLLLVSIAIQYQQLRKPYSQGEIDQGRLAGNAEDLCHLTDPEQAFAILFYCDSPSFFKTY